MVYTQMLMATLWTSKLRCWNLTLQLSIIFSVSANTVRSWRLISAHIFSFWLVLLEPCGLKSYIHLSTITFPLHFGIFLQASDKVVPVPMLTSEPRKLSLGQLGEETLCWVFWYRASQVLVLLALPSHSQLLTHTKVSKNAGNLGHVWSMTDGEFLHSPLLSTLSV